MKISAAHIRFCKKIGVDPENVPEIPTFETACKITGDDPKKLPIVKHLPTKRRKSSIALYKLEIIVQAFNGNKKPDYTDTNQYKYYPCWNVKADAKRKSGFGLSFYDFGIWPSYSSVGVRLSFLEWNCAKYAAYKYIKLYEEAYLLK